MEWGPALTMHREEVARYTPGFVVDPWSTVEPTKAPILDDEVALHVSRSYSVVPEYNAQSAPRLTANSGVVSQPGDIFFMVIGHEIISTAILTFPLIKVHGYLLRTKLA